MWKIGPKERKRKCDKRNQKRECETKERKGNVKENKEKEI